MKRSKLFTFLFAAFSASRLYIDDPGNPPAPPSPPAPPPAPETFSKEYVRELREENKGWRLKVTELEGKNTQLQADLAKAATDADAKIKEVSTAADQRIIRAEMKAAALKAGMVDLDGLKLADLSKVKLGENGEVEGAEAIMEEMKKAKPYLFGQPSTSNPQNPPPNNPPAAKKVSEMTPEEYAAAKAKLLNT